MISVCIKINLRTIIHRCAVNISDEYNIKYGHREQVYKVTDQITNDTWILRHVFENGAAELSKAILNLKPEDRDV